MSADHKDCCHECTVTNKYPFLTSEIPVGAGGASGPGPSRTGAGDSVMDSARRVISEVLGWKVRPGDVRGFTNSLTQRFTLKEVNGHIESVFNPGNFMIQTELSGDQPITGAQASLLAQARLVYDECEKLLTPLESLRTETDEEDADALKALILAQYKRIPEELGLPGGPRVPLIDEMFDQLVGVHVGGHPDPDTIEGMLGDLRAELGLRRGGAAVRGPERWQPSLVNTIDEETVQTNFRVVVDFTLSLRSAWRANRGYFMDAFGTPFLGTQLVLIGRHLSVLSAEVDEARMLFDSLLVGYAERTASRVLITPEAVERGRGCDDLLRAVIDGCGLSADRAAVLNRLHQQSPWNRARIDLDYEPDGVSFSLEDFLGWVQTFASRIGPEQIQTGGKYAVRRVFIREIHRLWTLSCAIAHLAGGCCCSEHAKPSKDLRSRLAEIDDRLTNLPQDSDQLPALKAERREILEGLEHEGAAKPRCPCPCSGALPKALTTCRARSAWCSIKQKLEHLFCLALGLEYDIPAHSVSGQQIKLGAEIAAKASHQDLADALRDAKGSVADASDAARSAGVQAAANRKDLVDLASVTFHYFSHFESRKNFKYSEEELAKQHLTPFTTWVAASSDKSAH